MLLPFLQLFEAHICQVVLPKYIIPGKVAQKRQPNPYLLQETDLPRGMILNTEGKTVIVDEVSAFPCDLSQRFIKLEMVHNRFIPVEEVGNTDIPFLKIASQWTAGNEFSQFFQEIIEIVPSLIEIEVLESLVDDAGIRKVEVPHEGTCFSCIVVEEHDGVS